MKDIVNEYCPKTEPILIDTNIIRGDSNLMNKIDKFVGTSGNRQTILRLLGDTYHHLADLEEVLETYISIIPHEVRRELANFDKKFKNMKARKQYQKYIQDYASNISFLRTELQCRDPRESQFRYPSLSLANGDTSYTEGIMAGVREAFLGLPTKRGCKRYDNEADISLVALAYALAAKKESVPSIVSADQDIFKLMQAAWPSMHVKSTSGNRLNACTFTSPTSGVSIQLVNPRDSWKFHR